jgi:hypothetical protein
MAAKTYLGFEEKYLSKHFESEYVAYHNNLKSLRELQQQLPPSYWEQSNKPKAEICQYANLGMVDGSEVTLQQLIEKTAGEDPANITISVFKDYDGSVEGYELGLTVFGPNPRYEEQLKTYNADIARHNGIRAKIAVVEKRLAELSGIFDAALAKLL